MAYKPRLVYKAKVNTRKKVSEGGIEYYYFEIDPPTEIPIFFSNEVGNFDSQSANPIQVFFEPNLEELFFNSDYEVLGNTDEFSRRSKKFIKVDRNLSQDVPSNLEELILSSLEPNARVELSLEVFAEVQDSNYNSRSWLISRYNGTELNTIKEGLEEFSHFTPFQGIPFQQNADLESIRSVFSTQTEEELFFSTPSRFNNSNPSLLQTPSYSDIVVGRSYLYTKEQETGRFLVLPFTNTVKIDAGLIYVTNENGLVTSSELLSIPPSVTPSPSPTTTPQPSITPSPTATPNICQSITLNYDASEIVTACAFGTPGTYYINSFSFSSATFIYSDITCTTPAPSGVYVNTSTNVYRVWIGTDFADSGLCVSLTPTPTVTPTATPSPTLTPTPSVTQSPGSSASTTPTPTPTTTATPSVTATPGGSASATPTPTPTRTATPSISSTPGGSPSSTPTPTPSITPSTATIPPAVQLTPGTGFNEAVYSLDLFSDRTIVAGGNFTSFNGNTRNYVVKLNENGTDSNTFTRSFNNLLKAVHVDSSGKVVAGGLFTSYDGTPIGRITRINTDGTNDSGFSVGATGFGSSVNTLDIASDGGIVVGGAFTSYKGVSGINRIAKVQSNGSQDTSFTTATGTGFNDEVTSVDIQSTQRIVVGGWFTTFDGTSQGRITRLEATGERDVSFNSGGSGFNDKVEVVKILSSGKIMVGGIFTTFNGSSAQRIARLTSSGTNDSFGKNIGNGVVYAIAEDSSGNIYIGGSFTDFDGQIFNRIVKVSSGGVVDVTFDTNMGSGFNGTVYSIKVEPSGTLLIGGAFTTYNGLTYNRIVRLNSDGTVNTVATTPTPTPTRTSTPPAGSASNTPTPTPTRTNTPTPTPTVTPTPSVSSIVWTDYNFGYDVSISANACDEFNIFGGFGPYYINNTWELATFISTDSNGNTPATAGWYARWNSPANSYVLARFWDGSTFSSPTVCP
jgi:uncharacterized delta-60 repeat protein